MAHQSLLPALRAAQATGHQLCGAAADEIERLGLTRERDELKAIIRDAPVLLPDGLSSAAKRDPEMQKYFRKLAEWAARAHTALSRSQEGTP